MKETAFLEFSPAGIQYALEHVFLPIKVTQNGDDPNLVAHETSLLAAVHDALCLFSDKCDPQHVKAVQSANLAISRLQRIRDPNGFVEKDALLVAFQSLEACEILPIQVTAQNAGIIVTRKQDCVIFEPFELSPDNYSVVNTKGRLKRSFPASSVAVDIDVFQENGLQSALAHAIAKMSCQEVAQAKATVRKAGESHVEDRDTTSPTIVTEFLVTVLSAMGRLEEGSQILKHTRDEVFWSNALLPWHRSPLWLFVRVALQLSFSRLVPGSTLYKEFMIVFMASLLQTAGSHELPSDTLYCMMAKISRRLLKIKHRNRKFSWLSMVDTILASDRMRVEDRWENIISQSAASSGLRPLSSGEIDVARYASYTELDAFIQQIHSPRRNKRGIVSLPSIGFRTNREVLPCLKSPTDGSRASDPFELLEVEAWVSDYLDEWLEKHIADEKTCQRLSELMSIYHLLASSQYCDNPESLSLMILVIMELWIAADKSATLQHGLMMDFDPEIPVELLQSLILPFKREMERFLRIEKYIQDRRAKAHGHNPSIYHSFGKPNSFAVQYFASSEMHQAHKRSIEDEAALQREAKRKEYQELKAIYDEHMDAATRISCTYRSSTNERTGRVKNKHEKRRCQRCGHMNAAGGLQIAVHEWPLPEDTSEASAVVFELHVPPAFGHWRVMSVYLLMDVLKCKYNPSGKKRTDWTLQASLPSWYQPTVAGRISLVSTTKPNKGTHRKVKSLSTAMEDSVLVKNGLQFHYYDFVSENFVGGIKADKALPRTLMYKLSEASHSLQDFMLRTWDSPNGMTPNDVIAQQASCPEHLSLEEYKAMASVAVGYRIQWLNILVGLQASSLDLKKLDTVLILMQVSLQIGPPLQDSVWRASHQHLAEDAFGGKLLESLWLALARIEANWETFYALSVLISLGARLLSLTSSSRLAQMGLWFLAKSRQVALKWLRDLQHRAKEAEDAEERTAMFDRVFHVSHVCVSSFDIGECHLDALLANPDQESILLEASMAIQWTAHCVLEPQGIFCRLSTGRWRRLLHKCKPLCVRNITEHHSSSLDDAIRSTWPAYKGSGAWRVVYDDADSWVDTTSDELRVHYNLLTGELLVDCMPLSRMPSKYEKHPIYETLFGKTMVEVLPSAEPGMDVSVKKRFHGYTLSLGMIASDASSLLIKATNDCESVYLVPASVFEARLPHHFVHDHVHWYNGKTRIVEFRPKAKPWISSAANWRLQKTIFAWVMCKGNTTFLLSPRSDVVLQISNVLNTIESDLRMHMVHRPDVGRIDIDLPRLQLGFFMEANSDTLHSRQFRGMTVDSQQEIGTLIGLQSKLVLRNRRGHSKVLIPNGQVRFNTQGGEHPVVTVDHDTSTKVHPFDVDRLLGRLVDDGSLQSKLILAYLHALTSYCLPDPLTGSTGTEESLSILNSAAMRSFQSLSEDNVDMLYAIAKLSPDRRYYPPGRRNMETIVWDSRLSALSQHGHFVKSVEEILAQARRCKVLYPYGDMDTSRLDFAIDSTNADMRVRHLIRAATFQLNGFGGEDYDRSHDAYYEGRDNRTCSEAVHRVHKVSTAVREERKTLDEHLGADFVDDMWSFLSQSPVLGRDTALQSWSSVLDYDAYWLGDFDEVVHANWCQFLYTIGNRATNPNKFQVLFCLASMAYSMNCNWKVLQTLVALFTSMFIPPFSLPHVDVFNTNKGFDVDVDFIWHTVKAHTTLFSHCPDAAIEAQTGESTSDLDQRRMTSFQYNSNQAIERFVTFLEEQWVCRRPLAPEGTDITTYIESVEAMQIIEAAWLDWYQNLQLRNILEAIFPWLGVRPIVPIAAPAVQAVRILRCVSPRNETVLITDDHLFQGPVPKLPRFVDETARLVCTGAGAKQDHTQVSLLAQRLSQQAKELRKTENAYARDLQKSIEFLDKLETEPRVRSPDGQSLKAHLQHNFSRCQNYLAQLDEALFSSAIPRSSHDSTAYSWQIGAILLAPRVSRRLLLRQLSRARWRLLSEDWRKAIVTYGLAVAGFQRAKRMLSYDSKDSERDLFKELANPGHANWNPFEYPESLLLEVESGITIRRNQEDIAAMMRTPPRNENAVMQLNMGEGKSSVIVPIVAAHLADGTRLVRVIVAKPQAKELNRTLVAKLGGLLNHQVYHLPFSRSVRPSRSEMLSLYSMCRECMEKGGVLLMQPEHMLSFQLLGIEKQLLGDDDVGTSIELDMQHFFMTKTRDLVDESDENFSVKFELVYTMGDQAHIDFSPGRWVIIQRLLTFIARAAPLVKQELPDSIDVTGCAPGRFPKTRTLRQDGLDLLLSTVIGDLSNAGLPGFPISRQSPTVRKQVMRYITCHDLSHDEIAAVEAPSGFFTKSIQDALFLLRGLFAGGLLAFAFAKKRWRVNYGPAPHRLPPTKLAVPYRAKDDPSPRSEFSHPDAVILLTCLSYYYAGLSDHELFLAFEHLKHSDQAEAEYDEWVRDAADLPQAFRRFEGVNLRDVQQATQVIFPCLRHGKSVVDYFLSHLVFAKEMREFPHKLSASGWDIGQKKTHPTTGFSGTNDSRHMLPLDVEHLDLDDQKHTNALVLHHLLGKENSVAYLPRCDDGTCQALLSLLLSLDRPVDVVLDVGAQIIDLTNIEVAQAWLDMVPVASKKEAVVFFDSSDELYVIDRQRKIEALHTSPYAQQLDVCLVFLDEAHTRGTDLRLPSHYRAAVTLGANLTKDKLVQACMRMRKLGHGQSVVFCVPEEIRTKIRATADTPHHGDMSVSDVLLWSMSETHADIRRGLPLWAMQGARFERQRAIWSNVTGRDAIRMPTAQAKRFLDREAQTLEERYRPGHSALQMGVPEATDTRMTSEMDKRMAEIHKRCVAFDSLDYRSSALDEEQERELAPELEKEREVQRPCRATPLRHVLDADVVDFVKRGVVPAASRCFVPAFRALGHTSASSLLDLDKLPVDLVVTRDFMKTVALSGDGQVDDAYQRPVQWVLSTTASSTSKSRNTSTSTTTATSASTSKSTNISISISTATSTSKSKSTNTNTTTTTSASIKKLVIISPFEAHELLPLLTSSSPVTLYLYAPRTNTAYAALDSLRLYTHPPRPVDDAKLPSHLRHLLNLYAGQLYFSSFADYRDTCEALSLAWHPVSSDDRLSLATHPVVDDLGLGRLSLADHPAPNGDAAVLADGFVVGVGRSIMQHSHGNGHAVQTRRAWGLDQSPVRFLGALLSGIRRDGRAIGRTHWGRVLGGELLTERDFD